ncbi:hypothetical protein [Gluconobacter morbifer]|uniref:hypothetical protein n=1 Tax=Gluconobacter morbifer TaxID=479935 RepID=UPI001111B08B|nr:hypothetical protein [Gluconobacter morbifer]
MKNKKIEYPKIVFLFYNNVDESFEKNVIIDDYRDIFKEKALPHINENIISIGKACSQSSTCSYSYSKNESSRALNILPRYGHSIHTDYQENPWWILDIGESKFVRNVYFFDRPEPELGGSRTKNLTISVGEEIENMKTVFCSNSDIKLWNLKVEVLEKIRFVKIHIEGYGLLNFDTVVVTD